jgi:hypothetical protein
LLYHQRISEHLFRRFQEKNPVSNAIAESNLKAAQRLYWFSICISGFIGAFIILSYYLPLYLYDSFFNGYVLNLTLFGTEMKVFWVKELDNMMLTLLELYVLGVLNIYVINKLAWLLGFPDKNTARFNLHRENLLLISLEKKQKKELELGLNPFMGMSKFGLYAYLLIVRFKAMLSNALLKVVLQRFGSRFLLKVFIDLAAMPIYAFWNGFAAAKLFNRARYYMLSTELTELVAHAAQTSNNPVVAKELKGLLNYIVVLKRDFSEINYFFSTRLLEEINHQELVTDRLITDILDELSSLDKATVDLITLIFATGIILDGNISRRERLKLKGLATAMNDNQNILNRVDDYLKAYKKGRGEQFLKSEGFI